MTDRFYVLDASALLAVMLGEEGSDHVLQRLGDSVIGAVNLSEVIAKLQERGVPEAVIDESLDDLNLSVVDFDAGQAMRAGKLRAATRSHGLSLGDRACLAAADILGATALTTDGAWADVDVGVTIEFAR